MISTTLNHVGPKKISRVSLLPRKFGAETR